MVSKAEFHEYIESLITSEDKEKLRKTKLKFTILLSAVLLAEAISFFVLIISVPSAQLKLIFLFFMFVVMFISFFVIRGGNSFKWKEFKEKNMPKILDFILKDMKYDYSMDHYIPEEAFKSSPFYDDYDEYSGEDLLSVNVPNDDGSDSNTWFHISDLKITKEETRTNNYTDSYGNSHSETENYTVTVFQGTFAHITFPTMFKCNLGINYQMKGTKRLNFEDMDYNKNLKTYSNDELQAFLILTPDLLFKIKKLGKKSKGLQLIVKDNKMFIKMSHNLFEFTKDKEKFELSMFDNFYDDLTMILGIVLEIKNNNKVFKF